MPANLLCIFQRHIIELSKMRTGLSITTQTNVKCKVTQLSLHVVTLTCTQPYPKTNSAKVCSNGILGKNSIR